MHGRECIIDGEDRKKQRKKCSSNVVICNIAHFSSTLVKAGVFISAMGHQISKQ